MSRDVAQLGRALRSGRRGRWFKSSRPDHFDESPINGELKFGAKTGIEHQEKLNR